MKNIIVGVDASRNRSGGAIDHIIGIITHFNISNHNIKEIHIWSYPDLLDQLPDVTWLKKHTNKFIVGNIFYQLFWQRFILKRELKICQCDVLFSSDASTLSKFNPMVTLSQDALSYEPGVMERFKYSKSWLRLYIIYHVQNLALKRSKGSIYLTKYARKLIFNTIGNLDNTVVIPHGIDDKFHKSAFGLNLNSVPKRIIYVSNYSIYKNQWHVVRAISIMKEMGIDVELSLVGGGQGEAKDRTYYEINKINGESDFIKDLGRIGHDELPSIIAEHDIFLFASSCETISITLLEGMAIGLPIACSDRGPMPEVLSNAGVYFDPESPESIVLSLRHLIENKEVRDKLANLAKKRSALFTWKSCSDNTWKFIENTTK